MKKITILCLHLGYGGIERAISTLSNILVKNYEIEIVSTYKLYDKPAFEINKNVKIKYLLTDLKPNRKEIKDCIKNHKYFNLVKEVFKAVKVLYYKKKTMVDYIKTCNSDVIITTRDIHNLWLSKYGNKDSVKIGWEHNHHNNNKKYINKIVKSVRGLDYFVLVSNELFEFYKDIVKPKTVCIPNFIDYFPKTKSKLNNHNIVNIGRLSKEKGQIDLIDIIKLVKKEIKDIHLDIIGEGFERNSLEEKIKKEHLSKNITLHGFLNKEEMDPILKNSSLFILPSFTESFGLVVLEAMAYKIPCLSFSSARGALEIIETGTDGYIIEDRNKKEMKDKIVELLNNQKRLKEMGNNALLKAKEFNGDKALEKWVNLIEKK